MKRLAANFPLLIVQLLPPHKRQSVRIKLLQSLINLESLYNSFINWRDEQTRLTNINGQIKILEGYLSNIFNTSITIQNYESDLTGVPLLAEGQLLPVGLLSEGHAAAFPLIGELNEEFKDADFIVLAPSEVDTESLKIEIEKFKLMNKKYKITQQ